MNRITAFASRNIKEMLRDPLSYIFCIGFPLVMLIVMTLVNESIPPEAGMTVFRIDNLAGGVAIFGQTFVMLFTAITVAGDRSKSFLVRMYASPMKSFDFIMGYMLPMIVISLVQSILTYAVSFVISIITGTEITVSGLLISIISIIPSGIMFVGFGLLLGTLFNEKAAPGVCSIIISLGSFLGGIWFDAEGTGGVMLTCCKCLPFFYCTKAARSAIGLVFGFNEFVLPMIISIAGAVIISAVSSAVFRIKMKADLS
ncbi:MAG: ABC transporter permease [Oscillospiraceae bacterium]|nr:ABC transporter permease [Oscillospiraceae bacterium]